MKVSRLFIGVLIGLLINIITLAVFAESAEEPEAEPSWKGNVELGYVSSQGNTETASLNGKFTIGYDTINWKQNFIAEAFTSSENNISTAERYKLEYQADRKFNEESYFFLNSTYLEDMFSGYNYRSTVSTGYGYKLYDTKEMTLDTEIGVGYRTSKLDIAPTVGNTTDNESLVRFAGKYQWDMAENRQVVSKLTIEAGEASTISTFDAGFVTMIAGDLSLKVAYTATHTSDVPLGKEKLDTKTSVNLLYAF